MTFLQVGVGFIAQYIIKPLLGYAIAVVCGMFCLTRKDIYWWLFSRSSVLLDIVALRFELPCLG